MVAAVLPGQKAVPHTIAGKPRVHIVAYDKRTGKEAWRTTRDVQITWATPVLVEAWSRVELVTNATEFAIAYDPMTGKELWRAKGRARATPSTNFQGEWFERWQLEFGSALEVGPWSLVVDTTQKRNLTPNCMRLGAPADST